MTNDELLSKTISYLRFPLTVGVVFIHFDLSQGLDIGGTVHGLNNPAWYYFIINVISGTLASIGVPLFFIISGFLFFYHADFSRNVYTKKIHSRIRTLFIPYMLWNFIAILWQFKCFLPGVSAFYPPVEVHMTPQRIINTFFCNVNGIFESVTSHLGGVIIPIDGPLWYVRDLMVMVLLSPIIFWLVKKLGGWLITIEGIVWYLCSIIFPKESAILIYANMLVTASFFFTIGSFFSIRGENFVMFFRRLKYAPVIYAGVAITDVLTKGEVYSVYIHKVGILLGIVSVVIVASYFLERDKIKVNKTLANSSFFIFALHYMIITNIGKISFVLLHIPGDNPFAMLALYFAVPFVTILLCLCLYTVLKRFTPTLYGLLTGGR